MSFRLNLPEKYAEQLSRLEDELPIVSPVKSWNGLISLLISITVFNDLTECNRGIIGFRGLNCQSSNLPKRADHTRSPALKSSCTGKCNWIDSRRRYWVHQETTGASSSVRVGALASSTWSAISCWYWLWCKPQRFMRKHYAFAQQMAFNYWSAAIGQTSLKPSTILMNKLSARI